MFGNLALSAQAHQTAQYLLRQAAMLISAAKILQETHHLCEELQKEVATKHEQSPLADSVRAKALFNDFTTNIANMTAQNSNADYNFAGSPFPEWPLPWPGDILLR